jgi:hypothetical protein
VRITVPFINNITPAAVGCVIWAWIIRVDEQIQMSFRFMLQTIGSFGVVCDVQKAAVLGWYTLCFCVQRNIRSS